MYYPTLHEIIEGFSRDEVDRLCIDFACQSLWDLFQLCGENWNKSCTIIERDFFRYIYYGDIPYYIRVYLYSKHKN